MRYTSKLIIALGLCIATSLCAFADVHVPIDHHPDAKAIQPAPSALHMITSDAASPAATPQHGFINVLTLVPALAFGNPLASHGPQLLAAGTCLSSPPPWYCPAAAPGVAAATRPAGMAPELRLAAYDAHEDEVDEGAHDDDT